MYDYRILKAVVVPVLEQSHVQADMRTSEPGVGFYMGEEGVEVAYVVHVGDFLSLH